MARYLLSDTELKHLSALSSEATVFFSLSASCLSFAIGLWIDPDLYAGTGKLTPLTETLLYEGIPFLSILATLFALIGYDAIRRRRATMRAIGKRAEAAESAESGESPPGQD